MKISEAIKVLKMMNPNDTVELNFPSADKVFPITPFTQPGPPAYSTPYPPLPKYSGMSMYPEYSNLPRHYYQNS